MKKIISIIMIAVVLVVGGCFLFFKSNEETFYMLETLDGLGEVADFKMTTEGELVTLTQGEHSKIAIMNKQKEVKEIMTLEQPVLAMDIDETNRIYIATMQEDKVLVEGYDLTGEKLDYTQTVDVQGNRWISQFKVQQGTIYLVGGRNLVVKQEGETEQIIPIDSRVNIQIASDGSIYHITYSDRAVTKLDTKTGEAEELFNVDSTIRSILLDEQNQKLYALHTTKIEEWDLATKTGQMVVDLNKVECLYDAPTSSFARFAQEDYLIKLGMSNKVGVIQKATQSEIKKAKGVDDNILKEDEILEAMVVVDGWGFENTLNLYNASVNQKAIQLKVKEMNGVYGDDFTKSLNLEILSGNTPDIMEISGLPYEKYIENNILMPVPNLKALCSGYNNEVMQGYTINDNTYAFMLDYDVMVLDVNHALLKEMGINFDFSDYTFDEFMVLIDEIEAKKADDVYIFAPYGSSGFTLHSIDVFYQDYIKDNLEGNWQEPLDALLTNLDRLTKISMETPHEAQKAIFSISGLGSYDNTPSMGNFEVMPTLNSDYRPIQEGGMLFGISNLEEGVKKQNALDYLKYTLSKEIQLQTARSFPVNDEARAAQREEILMQDSSLKENADQIDAIIAKQKGVSSSNPITSMLNTQISKMCYQGQSIEETKQNIVSAIELIKYE